MFILNTDYQLIVNNIKDLQANKITDGTTANFRLTGPQLTSVQTLSAKQLLIRFSQLPTENSVLSVENYSISGAAGPLISATDFQPSVREVLLTLEKEMTFANRYILSAGHIENAAMHVPAGHVASGVSNPD